MTFLGIKGVRLKFHSTIATVAPLLWFPKHPPALSGSGLQGNGSGSRASPWARSWLPPAARR